MYKLFVLADQTEPNENTTLPQVKKVDFFSSPITDFSENYSFYLAADQLIPIRRTANLLFQRNKINCQSVPIFTSVSRCHHFDQEIELQKRYLSTLCFLSAVTFNGLSKQKRIETMRLHAF